MLARAIPDIIPARRNQPRKPKPTHFCPESRDRQVFGRFFGRLGSLRGRNPFYRKKWVPSPQKVYQLLKAEN